MRPAVGGRNRGGATEPKRPAAGPSGERGGGGRAGTGGRERGGGHQGGGRAGTSGRESSGGRSTSGRSLAASILDSVEAGRRLDVAWEAAGANDSAHRAWVRSLVYGVIRLRGRLDYVLQEVSGRDPAALDPPVRLALRMGAYQLLEMKTVPAYAAVSESVRAAKRDRRSRAAAGLVNAALRKLAATPPAFPRADEDLESFLATWGSHPRWLVRRWLRDLGPREAHRVVLANNEEPATHLRPLPEPDDGTNPELARGHAGMARHSTALPEPGVGARRAPTPEHESVARNAPGLPAKGGGKRPPTTTTKPLDRAGLAAQAQRRLADAGLAATIGPGGGVRLGRGIDPRAALRTVRAVVQDPAASRVADYAAPAPGSLVIDLCAAPGGKALALGAAGVVAADASPARLARVADALDRLRRMGGAPKVWPVAADARRPPVRTADMALLDAPCSATGVIRRRPDARWRLSEDRLRALAELQRELIRSAAAVVPPGGLLVYATCSIEPEENGSQVSDFLSRNPDFRMEPGPAPEGLLDDRGCLAVLPAGGPEGHDGAFAARMRREPHR